MKIGSHHSETARQKMHQARLGRVPWNKGVPHSIATRVKISEGCQGKEKPESMRIKTSGRMIGNTFRLGKKATLEQRTKRSISQMGEKGPNWRGGLTEINKIVRASIAYTDRWIKPSLERDNYTCQGCGGRGVALHVHHLCKSFSRIIIENKIDSLEKALSCDELWDLKNSQTLCIPCHKETDTFAGRGNQGRSELINIMNITI